MQVLVNALKAIGILSGITYPVAMGILYLVYRKVWDKDGFKVRILRPEEDQE